MKLLLLLCWKENIERKYSIFSVFTNHDSIKTEKILDICMKCKHEKAQDKYFETIG